MKSLWNQKNIVAQNAHPGLMKPPKFESSPERRGHFKRGHFSKQLLAQSANIRNSINNLSNQKFNLYEQSRNLFGRHRQLYYHRNRFGWCHRIRQYKNKAEIYRWVKCFNGQNLRTKERFEKEIEKAAIDYIPPKAV